MKIDPVIRASTRSESPQAGSRPRYYAAIGVLVIASPVVTLVSHVCGYDAPLTVGSAIHSMLSMIEGYMILRLVLDGPTVDAMGACQIIRRQRAVARAAQLHVDLLQRFINYHDAVARSESAQEVQECVCLVCGDARAALTTYKEATK